MKQIIPSLVALLAISAGGGAAYFLKSGGDEKPSVAAHDKDAAESDGDAEPKKEKKEKRKKGKKEKKEAKHIG